MVATTPEFEKIKLARFFEDKEYEVEQKVLN